MKKELFVKKDMIIKEAMQQIGKVARKILFVVDDYGHLLGSLSDGDIRRWVLAEGKLNDTIERVYNKRPTYVYDDYKKEDVQQKMLRKRIETIPVVNKEKKIKDVLIWQKLFGNNKQVPKRKLNIPVVIMAGGRGTRLDPYTRVLPKPLMPIGEKTILEIIMEKFQEYDVNEFYLSINHKSHIIKAYFDEINSDFKFNFITEKKPLGTVGSLTLLPKRPKGSLLVTNCDIIIECDYEEILKFHNKNDNDITIVSSFRHFTIPYGVCRIEDGGNLVDIVEKPEYDLLANTGMYILKSEMIDYIPKNKFFNMTDLITCVKNQGGNICVFPIDQKSWIDIGQLEEYHHTLKMLELRH